MSDRWRGKLTEDALNYRYAVLHDHVVSAVFGIVNHIQLHTDREKVRSSVWKPYLQSMMEKYGKDAVRVEYPLDPNTGKQPLNAKRMESLLGRQIFKEFPAEAGKIDDRKKRVGAAKNLVKKRVDERKKKLTSTTKKSRRKSKRKSKQSDSASTENEDSTLSQSGELSSETIWAINVMNNMNADCEDDESADLAQDPFVFAAKKTTAADRAARYDRRRQRKEDD